MTTERKLHNPNNLTDWGQSEGYRLLFEDEVNSNLEVPPLKQIERFNKGTWDKTGWWGHVTVNTFRTRCTPEQIARLRAGLPAEEPGIPAKCTYSECSGDVSECSYLVSEGYSHSCKKCGKGYPEKKEESDGHPNDGKDMWEVFREGNKTFGQGVNAVAAEVRRRDGNRVAELEAQIEATLKGIRVSTEAAAFMDKELRESKAEVERLKAEVSQANEDRQSVFSHNVELIKEQDRLKAENEKANALVSARSAEFDVKHKSEFEHYRLEEFTKAALQGMCSRKNYPINPRHVTADDAVMQAKATLAALDALKEAK